MGAMTIERWMDDVEKRLDELSQRDHRPSLKATGNTRTTEPRKTWLDECAMMAMAGMLGDNSNLLQADKTIHTTFTIAKQCYDLAEAMLAEKIKREAKE